MKNDKILVVKYGSGCLVNRDGIDQQKIDDYARKLTMLGYGRLVVVTSGAVAVGRGIWLGLNGNAENVSNSVLASVGSAGIAEAWRQAFAKQKRLTGQLLVTHREIDDEHEGPSLQRALRANAAHNVVSIVNENDALSDSELKKLSYGGDNDGLAAHIAIAVSADCLLILTSVEGFLQDGIVRPQVSAAELETLREHLYEASQEGIGSMQSKLEAAARAVGGGVETIIASANADYEDVINNKAGTRVLQ